MDKAEQPTTQADRRLDELKPRDIDGHLSDAIQDCLRQRFGLVLSTSETTIMAQGAIAALNTRTASPAAQDGLVAEIERQEGLVKTYRGAQLRAEEKLCREQANAQGWKRRAEILESKLAALSAIKEQHHD